MVNRFIARRRVMGLATNDDKGLWIANVMYAERDGKLIFHSSLDTRHGAAMEVNPKVAMAIYCGRKISRLRGVQMTAKVHRDDSKEVRRIYLRRFPIARFMKLTLWVAEPDCVKFTDNRIGSKLNVQSSKYTLNETLNLEP